MKHLINESFKFIVCKGAAEFTERIRQPPVVSLVVFGVFGMKKVPQGIALLGIVAGDGPHV